jgi:hypothetical protein
VKIEPPIGSSFLDRTAECQINSLSAAFVRATRCAAAEAGKLAA